MARLQVLELELEAVTPLWIGGAGGRAELRPPSFRGCMRYWFRALAGGLLGEKLPDVRAAETSVYGNFLRASAVAVRLRGAPRIASSVTPGATEPLPGLDYMFWSVLQQRRDAILPGERFQLRLQMRPYPFLPVEVAGRKLAMPDNFELAAASLWLLLRLCGVGARTRRAAGGMRVVAQPDGWPATLPSLLSTAATPAELARELSEGIKQVRQMARWPAQPLVEPSSFDILHERVCQLYLVERTFGSWWEAVNWAGEQFLAFRGTQVEDAAGIAGLLTRGRLLAQTIKRAVLGLPIMFFFKSLLADLTSKGVDPREARKKASATVGPTRGLGRTSPLFFRIIPLASQPPSYAVLMGLFRSRLLPDMEMTVKPGDYALKPVRVKAPTNFALVEQWFDHVKGQGAGLVPVAIS